MIDQDEFRSVMGRFASGVTIVTSLNADGVDVGMTVSAFCSLSLNPPLILFCVDQAASMYKSLASAPGFIVNILSEKQEPLARRFSGEPNRFDGIGYTRGVSGFFSFSTDDPPTGPPPSPVVLTSFKVFDTPFSLDADISALSSITIPYSARFFSFTFAALDYDAPEKNQYMYRLEGFDPDWVWAGSRRYASYTNLDPGTYLFRVRASNSEGIWNREGASS